MPRLGLILLVVGVAVLLLVAMAAVLENWVNFRQRPGSGRDSDGPRWEAPSPHDHLSAADRDAWYGGGGLHP